MYGTFFSQELQKMAFMPNFDVSGKARKAGNMIGSAINRSGIPEEFKLTQAYNSPGGLARTDPKPPSSSRNPALESYMADWKKQNPDLGSVQAQNLGTPNTQFNPPKAPKLTTLAPQQQNQDQFRPAQRSTVGQGGRFSSPMR